MKYEKIIEAIIPMGIGFVCLGIVMGLFKGSPSEGFIAYLLGHIFYRTKI